MQNNLGWYRRPLSDDGIVIFAWVPYTIGALAILFGGLMMLPPFMWMGLYVLIGGLVMIIVNKILYSTNVCRGMTQEQFLLYSTYDAIPAELQKQVPLTVAGIKQMPKDVAHNARLELGDVLRKYNRLQEEKARHSGPAVVFRQQLAELNESMDSELEITNEGNRHIERMIY